MAYKVCLFILSFLSVAYLGYALTETRLPDLDVNHISNSIVGRSIGIAKSFLDTLVSCHVVFPGGQLYEAYPNYNIPHPNLRFGAANALFTSCNIEFKGVGVDFSGVYELLSVVRHRSDNSLSLTKQRFNITISLITPSAA